MGVVVQSSVSDESDSGLASISSRGWVRIERMDESLRRGGSARTPAASSSAILR